MLLSYLQPIDKVEKYLLQHINYLDKYYGSGHFIASGRKEPRTGSVILCRADNKEEVIAIMKEDPFYIHKMLITILLNLCLINMPMALINLYE